MTPEHWSLGRSGGAPGPSWPPRPGRLVWLRSSGLRLRLPCPPNVARWFKLAALCDLAQGPSFRPPGPGRPGVQADHGGHGGAVPRCPCQQGRPERGDARCVAGPAAAAPPGSGRGVRWPPYARAGSTRPARVTGSSSLSLSPGSAAPLGQATAGFITRPKSGAIRQLGHFGGAAQAPSASPPIAQLLRYATASE